jgi:hypothetical protein
MPVHSRAPVSPTQSRVQTRAIVAATKRAVRESRELLDHVNPSTPAREQPMGRSGDAPFQARKPRSRR